jgi:parvulin-like peptidyl-prolyl isomerase
MRRTAYPDDVLMKFARHRHSLLVLGCAALLASGSAAAQESGAQEAVATAAGPVVSLGETANTVINMILVRVNGDPILLSEVRERVDSQLAALQAGLSEAEIAAQLPELRIRILEGMIDETMMVQRAERLGIIIGPNEVDRYVQQVRDNNGFASDAELEAELATFGMTMEGLRDQARKTLQQQRLVFEEVQRSVFVSEGEIVTYYAEHEEDFRTAEQVRLEQLVFIGSPAQLAEQAAAAATELRAGADLETVGGKFVDATAMADTGTFIAVSDLTQGLAEAVPNLETGVFSEPIQTNFGLSIVRVLERTEQMTAALDDVRDDIRNRLTGQRSQERMNKYLGDLRKGTRLEVLDPRLAGLDEAWKTAEDAESQGR